MRKEGLCTESIRAIQQYFSSLYHLIRGSKLTIQDYNPSSVVYAAEPIRAIWRYLALIETQLVVMTLSKYDRITNFLEVLQKIIQNLCNFDTKLTVER